MKYKNEYATTSAKWNMGEPAPDPQRPRVDGDIEAWCMLDSHLIPPTRMGVASEMGGIAGVEVAPAELIWLWVRAVRAADEVPLVKPAAPRPHPCLDPTKMNGAADVIGTDLDEI